MSSIVCKILDCISTSYGKAFFENIALSLSELIKSERCIIASFDKKNLTATTIANVQALTLKDDFTYSLVNTPCAETIHGLTYYDNNISTDFPKDKRLNKPLITTYLGIPINNLNDECIGLLLVMYVQPINNEEQIVELFNVISGRISAELSHINEQKVTEKEIKTLTATISENANEIALLKSQLNDSEKMSLLGNLVAGITHEVNTPLGIAITTHSSNGYTKWYSHY